MGCRLFLDFFEKDVEVGEGVFDELGDRVRSMDGMVVMPVTVWPR